MHLWNYVYELGIVHVITRVAFVYMLSSKFYYLYSSFIHFRDKKLFVKVTESVLQSLREIKNTRIIDCDEREIKTKT